MDVVYSLDPWHSPQLILPHQSPELADVIPASSSEIM